MKKPEFSEGGKVRVFCGECGKEKVITRKTYTNRRDIYDQCENLCYSCAARNAGPNKTAAFYRRRGINIQQRPCHDCGKATNNYRCVECDQIWKAKHRVNADQYDHTDYGVSSPYCMEA
jgi:hypothetical protein